MLFPIRRTEDCTKIAILKSMIKFFVMIILTLIIFGCPAPIIEIPWAYRADEKPIYATKYFTVKPPSIVGWAGEEYKFGDYECIRFRKYTAIDLLPHPPVKGPSIIFSAKPVNPEKYNYDINKILDDNTWKDDLLREITINNRRFFEINRLHWDGWGFRGTLRYVHLSKDLKVMYIVEIRHLPYDTTWENLPEDFKMIIESFEPIERE